MLDECTTEIENGTMEFISWEEMHEKYLHLKTRSKLRKKQVFA
jgi:hypothetical protein